MKKIILPFLCLILLSCARVQPTETPPPLPDPFSAPWEDRSVFQSGLIESQQSVLEGLEGASVYHIEFNIAEDLYHLSGHEEVQYTNLETVSLDQIQFRLFPNLLGGEMEVSNLQVDGQPVTPSLQLNDSLLIVPLASSLAPGDDVIASMDFDVTVPRDVELNYGLLSYSEDVLALAHAYPMIAVYDDEGWNAELPARYGDITYADMSFYIVKISAPSHVTVVSSGREVHRSEFGETQTLIVANGPARDFYLAASPLYEEISETFEGITLRSYAPKNLQAGSRAALETAVNSLELFNEKYSDYPYTELDIAATPTLAGGIEYPGLIVLNWNLYNAGGNDPGTRQTLDAVVAHEVAHQWYYNLVGDDQLDD
ncbi:MAG TPA: M1 family aminopeptidase, partial [Anaerolineales bacterium]|nr:M1 family aminopeptidase [Anaerolineales bacterium]